MAAESEALNGRKMWLSFVKEYENVHQVTHAQAMAACSPLWADPKIKEGYYKQKCKALNIDVPSTLPGSKGKRKRPTEPTEPGKPGRPKGTATMNSRRAKIQAAASDYSTEKVPIKRKSSNNPKSTASNVASSSTASMPRKKRLTELEKRMLEIEEMMKKMKGPIDDNEFDEGDDSCSDFSSDSSEEE